jgi:predicted nucleotidyltransferase
VAIDVESVADRLGQVLAAIDNVRLAYLFGSRARHVARPDSDYDIGVLLDAASARGDRGAIVRRLAGRLGNVVSAALIDIVVLNDAPPLLRHRILRGGRVLFQRSPEERVRFAISTIREYQDLRIRRERFARARIRRLEAGVTDGGSRDLLEKARGAARLLRQASRVS